jgi:hypothetical protein
MEPNPSIRVGTSPDGSVTYLVAVPPEALPPVGKRDLELAWNTARRAALGQRWGAVRGFRFSRPDGTHTDLALADPDAACWVAAIDTAVGLGTSHGMSLCLRLLALIELLAHARWARPLFTIDRGGADLHPALLRTAATIPLTRDARFDETGFRDRLSRYVAGFALEAPKQTARLGARFMNRTAAIMFTCLALASCAPGGDRSASGDSRLEEGCRAAVDRQYDTQHRADIFAPMSGVNAPQSGNYTSSANGQALSQIFARDNDIRDCVRRGGTTGR